MRFIAAHADQDVGGLRWGVEPICQVLSEHGCQIAPSTHYDALAATRTPSAQTRRDERLKTEITRVHADDHGVYGARKVWLALSREGIPVARCAVERLVRALGLAGARRGRRVRTAMPDGAAVRPADLLGRNFNPSAPNRTWVTDARVRPDLVRDGPCRVRDRRLLAASCTEGS